MASPQVEDGYTRIANEVIERLCQVDVSGLQLRLALLIIRQTWGWGRKSAAISESEFSRRTGHSRRGIRDALRELVSRGLITMISAPSFQRPTTWQFNKNWESWTYSTTYIETGEPQRPEEENNPTADNKHTPRGTNTPSPGEQIRRLYRNKESLKKVKAKKQTPADAGFDVFWEHYPLKVAKKDAQKAWAQMKPYQATTPEALHAALDEWKASEQWERGYVPHPATWLRGERWKDEVPKRPQSRASPPGRDRIKELRELCEADEREKLKELSGG